MFNMRQKDLSTVYERICEELEGFVLLSSVYHIGLSVFTKSAKYLNIVYRPGSECHTTIYCSDIN